MVPGRVRVRVRRGLWSTRYAAAAREYTIAASSCWRGGAARREGGRELTECISMDICVPLERGAAPASRRSRVTLACLRVSLSHASACHSRIPPRVTLSCFHVSLSHAPRVTLAYHHVSQRNCLQHRLSCYTLLRLLMIVVFVPTDFLIYRQRSSESCARDESDSSRKRGCVNNPPSHLLRDASKGQIQKQHWARTPVSTSPSEQMRSRSQS